MDAGSGMEGDGPTAGDSVNVGLIIASKNGIALDIACSKMIGLKPRSVYAIKEAVKRELYSSYKFENTGEPLPKLKFKKPKSNIGRLLTKLFKEKPIIVDEKKCVKCGICALHCPAKAITLKPCPIIDNKKCIRCFCCMEIWPQHALSLKD